MGVVELALVDQLPVFVAFLQVRRAAPLGHGLGGLLRLRVTCMFCVLNLGTTRLRRAGQCAGEAVERDWTRFRRGGSRADER